MKIAVTTENNQVFQHFGHCENFTIYNVENKKIVDKNLLSSNGQGHGALAVLLKQANIDVLICGGIGGGAKNALSENGIVLVAGAKGDIDKAVEDFINGDLLHDESIECNHHSHEEGHSCGSSGCGSNHCH